MILIFTSLLGLIVGSFLNVVIHRVPVRQSIVWPTSKCPECGAAIAPKDNVPLISYLLLRGRCRNCGESISPRYPLVEGITGLLFGAAALRFGLSVELLSALVLIGVLVALAAIDLERRLLPNIIVGPAAVAGFALSVLANPVLWWVYLISAVAVAGAMLALALLYPGGMGMGDVKMAGMLGTFLGPYAGLAVFVGALVGALLGGGLMAVGKMHRRTAMPFGVFMAFGGLVALFVGPGIWRYYINLVGEV